MLDTIQLKLQNTCPETGGFLTNSRKWMMCSAKDLKDCSVGSIRTYLVDQTASMATFKDQIHQMPFAVIIINLSLVIFTLSSTVTFITCWQILKHSLASAKKVLSQPFVSQLYQRFFFLPNDQ